VRRKLALFAILFGLFGFAVWFLADSPRAPNPEPKAPPAITATPPARLVGLGYLPAECNVVFAVQPGPLLEYAARTKQEPRELLAKAGVPEQLLGVLDTIGLPKIDHIAGGAPIGDIVDLRVALVLVLKQPLADEEAFRNRLKAKPGTGKHKYDTVQLANAPFMMARVSPTVWVFGFSEGDFSAVEKGGFGPGGTQFRGSDSDGLRKMLTSVPVEAAVWVAADDDHDWTQKPLVRLLASQSPEAKKGLPALGGGRGGLFALTFGDKLRMRLFVRTAETATAKHLRAYFLARTAELESATAGGEGTFALFDAPYDPKIVQRFLADLK
jgi:hypothetical protein